MLEQLDFVDELIQIGFIFRGQTSCKNGERFDALTYASSGITDTFYDYLLLTQQKHTEEVFYRRYMERSKASVHYIIIIDGFKFTDFGEDNDEHLEIASLKGHNGTEIRRWNKYLIGTDARHSTVRELAGVALKGEKNNRHFVRIGGTVKTSMHEARRGLYAIESAIPGSVLGESTLAELGSVSLCLKRFWRAKGANLAQEGIIREVEKAIKSFTLDFERIYWSTAYSVGQD